MISWIVNLMPLLFYVLFFFVPLVLYPRTSELFEFNKVILLYSATIAIVATWLIKIISQKKLVFRRTILDYPLLIFLGAQLLSMIFSIDTRTSIFGYYSRFHGGLLSSLSYSLLYWAYVSNMNFAKTKKTIQIILVSAILVAIYGLLERLGIDKNIWVQDVQNRVFSTLGQPNWLAAWLSALIPITWVMIITKGKKHIYYQGLLGIYSLFWLVLLYTRSRSGILAFFVSFFVFWGSLYLLNKNIKSTLKSFVPVIIITTVLFFTIGTPWTPSLVSFTKKAEVEQENVPVGPALEVGGTESGEIRKIVWKGAFDIWKNYPVFGSGVETFAYSYYNHRPVEHNLVSEWDFLYNKAHNEYLNFMATTGTVGFLAYLGLLGFATYVFINPRIKDRKLAKIKLSERELLPIAFLSGFSSIVVTNFFGFSVTPVALLFFLFPAFAITTDDKKEDQKASNDYDSTQLIGIGFVLIVASYLFFILCRYWYVDTLYAKGKFLNDSNNYSQAREILLKIVKYAPKEALYYDELAESTGGIALTLNNSGNIEAAEQFAITALEESALALELSPANMNIRRNRARLFIMFSIIDPAYLTGAKETLQEAVVLAPTDAKLHYNYGLTLARLGELNEAIDVMAKTVEMKSNYRDARFAYALLLADVGQNQQAIEELTYILDNLDPNDELVRLQLEDLR